MIPLFDALAHPTVNGTWLGQPHNNSFSQLVDDLETTHFMGACAVALANQDDYSHETFIQACRPYSHLVPIAGLNPQIMSLEKELASIKSLGFLGIKIHPRFSQLSLVDHRALLVKTLQLAANHGLVVFLCTYPHTALNTYPEIDPFYATVALLKQVPEARVVLVHGGDVEILKYAELVRFNNNLLLDLSLTMMKYEGSSIDQDIQFLFQRFDRRICIGSDHPEYTHKAIRARYEQFAQNLPIDKQINIAHRNITTFLNL